MNQENDCETVYLLITTDKLGMNAMYGKDGYVVSPRNKIAAQAEADQIKAAHPELAVQALEITGHPGESRTEVIEELVRSWNEHCQGGQS